MIRVTVQAWCLRCGWTAGPVPGGAWDSIDKAAGKHVAPGHPVTTEARPASG